MRSISSRKGQVGALPTVIIALLLAAMILVLGLIILESMRDVDTIREAGTATVTNESFANVSETSSNAAARSTAAGFNNFAVTLVLNVSDGETITDGNYTSTSDGTLLFSGSDDDEHLNGTVWRVSYTYTLGGQAYSATNDTLIGIATFAEFWDIIVIAIITGIIIGLLLVVFAGRGSR